MFSKTRYNETVKNKDNEKILKATEQKLVIYQGTLIRLSAISVCVLKTDTSYMVINDTTSIPLSWTGRRE